MMDPKMMKKANTCVKDLKESLPLKIEASHQKWIKATEEWTQFTQKGKRATYFDRDFSINDMTWRRLGNLKFNVKLWVDSDRWPRVCMDNNISKEILSDFKLLIEYSVDGRSGSLYYDHPYIGELYVSDRKVGTPDHNKFCKIFNNVEDIKNKSNDIITVTYRLTFELGLKKIEMPLKPKLLHKLYSEGEFSDLKIHCHGKVFDCHKIILSGTSKVLKKIIFENENDLENDMVEATSGKIKITDISPITMENLLYYIYHEDLLKVEAKIVLDLLYAAEKYAIFDLVK